MPTPAFRNTNNYAISISGITYADNAAAKTAGLVDGDEYRTSTGQLMIVYTDR